MSSHPHETFEHNGFTIELHYDDSGDGNANPRDYGGNLGVFLACNHRRYELGDHPQGMRPKEYDDAERAFHHFAERRQMRAFPRWARIFLGATSVLPVYLIDHSGLSVRAGADFSDVDPGGWDSGLLGFIFDTPRAREETGCPTDKIAEGLSEEIRYYDMYLTGDVHGYVIKDVNDDEVESCWGFLGVEYARESAKEACPDSTEMPEELHEVRLTAEQLVTLGSTQTFAQRLTAAQLDALALPIPVPEPTFEEKRDAHRKLVKAACAGLKGAGITLVLRGGERVHGVLPNGAGTEALWLKVAGQDRTIYHDSIQQILREGAVVFPADAGDADQ